MSFLFGGGSPAAPTYEPAPDPQIAKDAISKANAEERAKIRAKSGRASTNVTGGEGVTETAQVKKTTLGS